MSKKVNGWPQELFGIRKEILEFIRENGPVSSYEIGKALGCQEIVRATLSTLRRSPKLGEEKIYIKSWRRDADAVSGMLRLRPLYAVGDKTNKNAKRPPRLPFEEVRARYNAKQQVFVNSVFCLGAPSHTRKVRQYGRADSRTREV